MGFRHIADVAQNVDCEALSLSASIKRPAVRRHVLPSASSVSMTAVRQMERCLGMIRRNPCGLCAVALRPSSPIARSGALQNTQLVVAFLSADLVRQTPECPTLIMLEN